MIHPNSIVQAAEQAERAAGTLAEAVHRLALMAEPGYGGNITALVELLSSDRTAEETRLRQEVATLRAERDAALVKLPACCGSLADAADTMRQERDELAAERDVLKAKLERCETNLRAANSDCAEADTQMAALKAKLADAERDRDSFRESFVRVLDVVGCGNIFVSDEALVAGVREKMAELDATKARLAELLSHHQGQHAELQSILGSDDALAVLASRAVSDLAATKEKLADAERFASDLADDRRKLNSIRDDLCLVGKEMTELRKEHNDTKAKLAAAESAHSELFLSGQVAELRAKLAALVLAVESGTSTMLSNAIAEAKA